MTRKLPTDPDRPIAGIIVRQYRPDDAHSTRDVFDRAIRGTAARFYDPAQIEAWAQGGEIDLANAIFEYLEVFYNRRRRHCCLECATPDDDDLAGTPRALTITGS